MGTWALFSLRPIRVVDQLTYGRKKNQPRAVESPRANPYLFTGDSENIRKQKCLEMNQNQFLWTLTHILGHPNSTGALLDPKRAKKRPFLAVFQLFWGEKIIKGGDFSFTSSHPYKNEHFCSKQPFSQIHATSYLIPPDRNFHLSVPAQKPLYTPYMKILRK